MIPFQLFRTRSLVGYLVLQHPNQLRREELLELGGEEGGMGWMGLIDLEDGGVQL